MTEGPPVIPGLKLKLPTGAAPAPAPSITIGAADAPPQTPNSKAKREGTLKNMFKTCEKCGDTHISAILVCPKCGFNPEDPDAPPPGTPRAPGTPRDQTRARRKSEILREEEAAKEEEDMWQCVYCAQMIGEEDEFCPLIEPDDPRGEDKGPKVHPHCWDAFEADQEGRCRWCFKPVTSQSTAPRDGFVPSREVSDKGQAHFGRDGHWGRGHVQNAPNGGAAGSTFGEGKLALHQGCVDKYNAHNGNKCLWCKKPIHVGLEIEGQGMVHKGHCHSKYLEQARLHTVTYRCIPLHLVTIIYRYISLRASSRRRRRRRRQR